MSKVEILDTEKLFWLSSSVQVLPLDVTTPRDSDAWDYREVGLEPLTIGSMRKNLNIELS